MRNRIEAVIEIASILAKEGLVSESEAYGSASKLSDENLKPEDSDHYYDSEDHNIGLEVVG